MIYKQLNIQNIKLLIITLIVSSCVLVAHAAYEPFEIRAIKVTNTAAAEVNQAAATQFNNVNTTAVINTDIDSDVFTSVTTNGVVCAPGTYLVNVSLYHEGGNDRNSVGVEVTVNGIGTGIMGADGFVRGRNGMDEASTTVADVVSFTTASKIGFLTQRLARNGTATAPAGGSIMRIIRVDDNY